MEEGLAMNLSLVIPVHNQQKITQTCLDSFRSTAERWDEVDCLIIDNGSKAPACEWGLPCRVLRNENNIGVLPAMQQGYKNTVGDFIFFTHNDVVVYEHGWDVKIIGVLRNVPNVGVAGLFGAKGIGSPNLYVLPYDKNQLGRSGNVSGCHRMPAHHGYRLMNKDFEYVAVLDGFSLIINRRFLDENNGFDLNLPPHHMYDNHTCLQSLNLGYKNIVISLDAFHSGGQTDVNEQWNNVFGKSKKEIHDEAHYPYFYYYWHPDNVVKGKNRISLPFSIAQDAGER